MHNLSLLSCIGRRTSDVHNVDTAAKSSMRSLADGPSNIAKSNCEITPGVIETPMAAIPETNLSKNDEIISTLLAHAKKNKCNLTCEQIKRYVGFGELILNKLTDAVNPEINKTGKLELTITSKNGSEEKTETCHVESSPETSKAIIWAIYANLAQAGKFLLDEGTMVIKDPGHRIGDFLRQDPTRYERPSSHYANYKIGAKDKSFDDKRFKELTNQYGIDDALGRFPGEGGSLLFANIKATSNAPNQSDELFFKIEKHGFTPGFGLKAMLTKLQHSISYLRTRAWTPTWMKEDKGDAVSCKEHIHKDGLKKSIWTPFTKLVDSLENSDKAILKKAEQHGLTEVEAFLSANPLTNAHSSYEIYTQLSNSIKELYQQHKDRKDSGIGRRGNEVHIHWQGSQTSLEQI